jgi:4-amino-4-deoxy-L-arabinose transferase-like glycosyltransferase
LSRRAQFWLPLLLILIGFGLRLYRLDYPDITGDEAWSVTVASRPLLEVVASDAETNPPLYHVLLWGMLRLGGRSTLVVRYLSVLCGTLGLALMYKLGRHVEGRTLGVVALATGVISPFLVYYAQDARMYGPALVGAAGSMALFAWLRRDELVGRAPPVWRRGSYALFSLTAVLSHYYAFAILLAQAVYAVAAALKRRAMASLRPWVWTWTGMALIFLPWFAFHMTFLQNKTSNRFAELTADRLLDLARRTLAAYGGGVTLPAAATWLAWFAVLLAGLGAWALCRRLRLGGLGGWLALTVLGAPLFAWLVNPIMPFFWERYLLVGMPAFIVLLGAGLLALSRRARPLAWLGAILMLLVSQQALARHFFDPSVLRGSYGRLMGDVQRQAQPGDVILLNNPLQDSLYDIYGPPDMPVAIIDRGRLLTDDAAAAHLGALTAGYERAWLVEMGNEAEYDPAQRAQRWLAENGSRAYYQNYVNGGLLYLFILGEADSPWRSLDASLGQRVRLTGYRLNAATFAPGDTIRVSLRWEVDAPFARNYTVFNHLVAPDGRVVAQTDGEPVGGGRPTSSWLPGEVISDNYAILLPDELPAGDYTLRVGLYLWPELTRLAVNEADRPVVDDSVELAAIRVR